MQAPRPNVLFVFADDMTYDAVRALGNADVLTPHLDRLVARGTSFTRAYNMGGWQPAVCMASRSMMNSGRPLWESYRLHEQWEAGETPLALWSERMAAAGYRTYFTGKWHVARDAEAVFATAGHIRPGMPRDPWIERRAARTNPEMAEPNEAPLAGYFRGGADDEPAWSPTDTSFGGYWAGGRHWSEVVAEDALAFLRDSTRGSDEPFFMYLAFNAPHDPRQAPPAYQDLYSADTLPVPASFTPAYPYAEAMGSGRGTRDEDLAPFPRTPESVRLHTKEYYALISHMDAQIGRVLEALDAAGLTDDTYVIFTADHGLAMGRHGLLGKQSLFEHSVRAPFVIAGPGVVEGVRNPTPIYLQDAMATALEIAGAPRDSGDFFHSVLAVARGERASPPYTALYGAYTHTQRAIWRDDYKLLVFPEADRTQFFHLGDDPEELRDLSRDPGQRELVAALRRELVTLMREMGDTLEL